MYTHYIIYSDADLYDTLKKAIPGDYITVNTDNQEGWKKYKVLLQDGNKTPYMVADIYQTYDEPI